MGLFDKKYCDICGEKIGLLGNRKLDDGNLCKECAKKLSPWFEERRHSTVEDIKRQLEYREANKEKVQNFRITRRITTKKYTVFLDETQGNFTIAHNLDTKENPDILSLSDVVQCNMDVKQDRIEETYTKDGKTVSYQPPVYKYEYYYSMKIQVRSPWFDDMDFQLHSFAIEQENRAEMMEMERVGNEIIAALTGQAPRMQSGMPMNQGMSYGMNQGMNQGMQRDMNYGMNQGMQRDMNYGMNQGMNQGMQRDMNYGMNQGMSQGMQRDMNYGMNQGMSQGMQRDMNYGMNQGMSQGMQRDMNYGMNQGMSQGMQQDMNNMQQSGGTWRCQCGAENTGRFCEYCGSPRPF